MQLINLCRIIMFIFFATCSVAVAAADRVPISVEQGVVVVPAELTIFDQQAAEELAKHLSLITSRDVSIESVIAFDDGTERYPFYVGIRPDTDQTPFQDQESRWRVTSKGAWFYGDPPWGTLFAVYDFLENQLGIRWLKPGDAGIFYIKQQPLKLAESYESWTPRLMFRKIRQGIRHQSQLPKVPEELQEFAAYQASLEEQNSAVDDEVTWQYRMKMGGSRPGGAHAFRQWWDQYGQSHPEYFALTQEGTREPVMLEGRTAEQSREWIKICPSNPDVADQLIEDWLPRKDVTPYISVGPNDGNDHFCRCEACLALDTHKEGEQFTDHLTDRYVHLANEVARKARQYRPDAYVTLYAYLSTLQPPRRLKLEPNVVVLIVPYIIPLDLEVNRELFDGWQQAGARQIGFRPNYHVKYLTGVMPLGIEKQMFDIFQQAVAHGAISADYDMLTSRWPIAGFSDYILSRAMSDPIKPFKYWEQEYVNAFGPASEYIKDYYRYWREQVWEQRLKPDVAKIGERGGAGDFARGLWWTMGDYYRLEDFDKTDAILAKAMQQDLSAHQHEHIKQLVLANQHARLVYEAATAQGVDKQKPAEALLNFRKIHAKDLPFNWLGVFANEIGNGDVTGLKLAQQANKYAGPWLPTDPVWRFRLDPHDRGETEAWQELTWDQTNDWQSIRTDAFWENQTDQTDLLSPQIRKELPKYDGIGWYTTQLNIPENLKGQQVFLRFGAVDESCWVYLNGKFAGQHVYQHKNDWKTPFEIRIDPWINWRQKTQLLTVRVEDRSGMGGIWKPVWIVTHKELSESTASVSESN